MAQTQYSDLTPRQTSYNVAKFLVRALPFLVLEKFGQTQPLPPNETKSIKFRRYEPIAIDTTPLVEGTTPAAVKMTYSDVTATIAQYGNLIELTDVVLDTHEDNVQAEARDILSENGAQVLETLRFNVLKAGTSVRYTNGAARASVNTPVDLTDIRYAVRTLEHSNARKFTSILASSPKYDTHGIRASYWAACHPDLKGDIEDIVGFVPIEKYGSADTPIDNEFGHVAGVRFVTSTIMAPWKDGGGAAGAMITTTGVSADVYPILVFARDAFATVPLRGKSSISIAFLSNKPDKSDPLGQRAYLSWKTYYVTVILNDNFMIRIESAATA